MKNVMLIAVIALLVAGCGEKSPQIVTKKETQAQKAQAAANSVQFSENAEIENIKKRLELTSNPGLMGFVVLMNEMGQPVMYAGVKGKITSGSKRLTPSYELKRIDCGEWRCEKELPASSDEGTYGNSAEYIFFWTVSGQYVQWNGKYLYSDKPFRLSIKPLVIDI